MNFTFDLVGDPLKRAAIDTLANPDGVLPSDEIVQTR
jgi:hypothetical protein